jgi:hypothetical protein
MDDINLYNDLDGVQPAAVTRVKITTATTTIIERPNSHPCSQEIIPHMHHQPQQDHQQLVIQQLQKENITLKRNMGILYRTAKQEIHRKETQIQHLLFQLQQRESPDQQQTQTRKKRRFQ